MPLRLEEALIVCCNQPISDNIYIYIYIYIYCNECRPPDPHHAVSAFCAQSLRVEILAARASTSLEGPWRCASGEV